VERDSAASAQSNIALDGSLPHGRTDVLTGPGTGPDYTIGEELGWRAGSNLFHSFLDFDLATGDSATFTADAALLHTAERYTQVANEPAVDPHRACLERLGHAMSPLEVLCPYGRRKPILRAVGHLDCLRFVVEWDNRHNGAEDLLLVRATVHVEPGNDGWLDEVAIAASFWEVCRSAAAAKNLATLLTGTCNAAKHFLVMLL